MDNFDYKDDKLDKIARIINDSYHPTHDDLGNYILFKNGVDPEANSFLRLIPKIEQHLRKCSECSRLYLELNNEYASLDNYLNEEESLRISKIPEPVVVQHKSFTAKYSVIALVIVFLVGLASFAISGILTPLPLKYADLKNQSGLYETRGRVTYDFQESLKAFENHDYENAVKDLNKDISDNRGDETIFYSWYILGITYLESAQSDILGLFPSYDKNKVSLGISALNKTLELNNSGKFLNINLDIYFLLGKAYLMVNNKSGANEFFNKVIKEKGSHMNEAKNILSALN
jgi:hypothetical protein